MSWSRYIVRRIVSTLAVLLAVVMLTFWLSRYASDDPVIAFLAVTDDLETSKGGFDDNSYRTAAHKLGQDLPAFFISFQPSHYPDTLHRLLPLSRKQQATSLLKHGLEWSAIEDFQTVFWSSDDAYAKVLRQTSKYQDLVQLQNANQQTPRLNFEDVHQEISWPSLHWNGTQNSFWHFAGGMLRGDFGYSLQTGDAVADRIGRAFWVTLPIALLALLLSILLGTWLGTFIAQHSSKLLKGICYLVLSLPGFWVVTLAVTQLSGRGKPFPGPGWIMDGSLSDWLAHASLPMLVLALPAAAYLALVMDESLQQADRIPIRDFARLRGQSERKVWYSDMLRLGLVPSVVTVIGLLIPSFIGGSVVIEYVFNIPGLGRLVFESILSRDWPVVLGVVVLSSLATVLGYVLIDVINAWLDPRFRKLTNHVT